MTSTPADVLVGIAGEEAARVVALGSRVALSAGQVLFNLGDAAESLFVVERGRIALTLPMTVRDRQQDVLIKERAPGQSLGWSALVPPHRFTQKAAAAARAASAASRTGVNGFAAPPGRTRPWPHSTRYS